MRIVDQREPKTVSFAKVETGNIFYDANDTKCFFMKVAIGDDINAICLHDGMGYEFGTEDYVENVIAELIVHT